MPTGSFTLAPCGAYFAALTLFTRGLAKKKKATAGLSQGRGFSLQMGGYLSPEGVIEATKVRPL